MRPSSMPHRSGARVRRRAAWPRRMRITRCDGNVSGCVRKIMAAKHGVFGTLHDEGQHGFSDRGHGVGDSFGGHDEQPLNPQRLRVLNGMPRLDVAESLIAQPNSTRALSGPHGEQTWLQAKRTAPEASTARSQYSPERYEAFGGHCGPPAACSGTGRWFGRRTRLPLRASGIHVNNSNTTSRILTETVTFTGDW